jgi:hypothetical protein
MFFIKSDSPIFFVHIPKTAGTSFRTALMRAVKGKTLLDYGPASESTSKEVKEHIYGNNPQNRAAIAQLLVGKKFGLLSGHAGFAKYRSVVPIDRVVTFLRRPQDQVWSHYRHHVEHLGYQNSLANFAKDKRFSNIQSRYLSGCKIEALGFVGLTEQFDQSIELFNAIFNLKLDNLSLNQQSSNKPYSPEEEKAVVANNQQDMGLYRQFEAVFSERVEFFKRGLTWTSGWVNCNYLDGILSAQVWVVESVNPVVLEIQYEDSTICEVIANQHSPIATAMGAPNFGYVGVRHRIKAGQKIRSIIAKETGQKIRIYYAGAGA